MPRRLISWDNPAHGGGNNDVRFNACGFDFLGQRFADNFRQAGVFEDQGLLKKDGTPPPGRQNEVPFQQRAGFAKDIENVVSIHGLGFQMGVQRAAAINFDHKGGGPKGRDN